jgi:hypothetical protein
MEKDKIIDFLIKAKRATYAGKGPEKAASRPMSHDLEYMESDLKYIDTYLGGEKFAGEEALWENNCPIWAMNYYGRVIADEFNGDFLKDALFQIPRDMPFRGPCEFKKDNFTYHCSTEGGFEWFSGHEEIYYNKLMVYECIFHGGIIK